MDPKGGDRRRRRLAPALRRYLAARRLFEPRRVQVGGLALDVRCSTPVPRHGGPAVVLVPGLGLSGRYVLPLGAELAGRHRVWVPDLPGYGLGAVERLTLDIPDLADVLASWMATAGVAPAALVGSSMGCQVAVEVAARHPDLVTHLVLEGPTMDAHARSVPRHAVRLLRDAPREPPSLVPLQVREWAATGPRRLAHIVRSAFAHAVEDRLGEVRCPALVVRGGNDPIVPDRWAREVAAGLPCGRIHVVPGGSHAMTYSDPERLGALVLAVLGSGDPAATATT